MTSPENSAQKPQESAREAAERNAQAVMTGNLAQLMADISPEALAQMMQMAAEAEGLSLTQLPNVSGYEICEMGIEDGAEVFNLTFHSSAGSGTLTTKWKPMLGQWKIVGIGRVPREPAPEA